jgi:hypothetical protein
MASTSQQPDPSTDINDFATYIEAHENQNTKKKKLLVSFYRRIILSLQIRMLVIMNNMIFIKNIGSKNHLTF